MEVHEVRHLRDVVREHRAQLAATLAGLAEHPLPPTDRDAEQLHETLDRRLKVIEETLAAYEEPPPTGPLTRARRHLRQRLGPNLGQLQHHAPRPLRVPAAYLRERPPSPAPTISLVTPSFGQGAYIERAILSVVSQGYPALEYVVQDGGSSDGTVEVLERLDPLLSRWASEPDRGQGDALNRGFAHTSGEIMAWLNSDDMLLPGSLAYVARTFAEHPDVDVVYGDRILVDENDDRVGAWILPQHDDAMLTTADYVPQETLFWRRRAWEAAGGRIDADYAYALDWDLLLRLRAAGAVFAHVPRFLAAFRVHAAQKTTRIDLVGFDEIAQLRRRTHGRYLPHHEVLRALEPYYRNHMVARMRHRLRSMVTRTAPVHASPRPDNADGARVPSPTELGAPERVERHP